MITQSDIQNLRQKGYRPATAREFNEWFLVVTGESDQKIKMEVIKKIQGVKQKHNLPPDTHIIPLSFRFSRDL